MIKLDNEISLYIHIPYCFSKCDYCDFFSIACNKIPDEYIDSLCREISFRINLLKSFNQNLKLSTIYVGGGTPSLMNIFQFERLFLCIKNNISFCQNIEVTVELNPDDVNAELLLNLEKFGVNRISCGIQSMNDKALKFVNRRADSFQNLRALDFFKNNWKAKLSLDLIAGLPYETEKSFTEGIKKILEVNPDHISLYTLTVEEGTCLYEKISEGVVEYDFDFSDKLWLLGKDLLKKNHYEHYEVSNFAKKGYECEHNLSYWQHKNYIGCGSGATGTIYNRDKAYRWTNVQHINSYIDFWNNISVDNEVFNFQDFFNNKEGFINQKNNFTKIVETELIEGQDLEFEYFMMGLRTSIGINSLEYKKIFFKELNENFCKLIENWKEKGLAEIEDIRDSVQYKLNSKGILFLNKFLEDLNI